MTAASGDRKDSQEQAPALRGRARIEQAALGVFLEKGFDAATTRDIAERAGVSEGTIYRHFQSKDELGASIFFAIHDALAAMMRKATAGSDGLLAKADAIVAAYVREADKDWDRFCFHLIAAHRFMPRSADGPHAGRDNPVAVIEEFLSRQMTGGSLPKAPPALLAGMTLGVVTQTALQIAYGRLHGPMSKHLPALKRSVSAILAGEIARAGR